MGVGKKYPLHPLCGWEALSPHCGNMAGNRVFWNALLVNAPAWENALP